MVSYLELFAGRNVKIIFVKKSLKTAVVKLALTLESLYYVLKGPSLETVPELVLKEERKQDGQLEGEVIQEEEGEGRKRQSCEMKSNLRP